MDISAELLAEMLTVGYVARYRVVAGVPDGARIIDCEWISRAQPFVRLYFDRDVNEPAMKRLPAELLEVTG